MPHDLSTGSNNEPKSNNKPRRVGLERFSLLFLLEIFANILIGIILFLLLVQVIGRYVLHTMPNWSSEESTLLFLMWMAAVGTSLGSATKSHLVIDSLVNVFPEKVQRIIEIIVYLLVSAFLIITFVVTVQLAWLNREAFTPRLHIPMSLIQASIPFGMGVMLYYNVKHFVQSFHKESQKEEQSIC